MALIFPRLFKKSFVLLAWIRFGTIISLLLLLFLNEVFIEFHLAKRDKVHDEPVVESIPLSCLYSSHFPS